MHIEASQSKSEAAIKLRAKLEAQIEEGRASAAAVLERIQNEVPQDVVVSTDKLGFVAEGQQVIMHTGSHETAHRVHENALGQIAERASIPGAFARSLLTRGDWGARLLADNLSTIFNRQDPTRALVRSVNGQARGFLSDKYRRIDCRPIVDAFAAGCQKLGAVPVEGVGGELRIAIKALLPVVFEPFPNEIIAVGVQISNSDFGAGALSLRGFMLRLACINGMVREEALRQIHLGGRLADSIEFSKKTYALDTRTMSSAVSDMMNNMLGVDRINESIALVKRANGAKVEDVGALLRQLQKTVLHKSEADAVRDVFNDGGIEQLPPGQTVYRMAQAVSWVAKSAKTAERRLELEQRAGELLDRAA